jgi:hypothetical protein
MNIGTLRRKLRKAHKTKRTGPRGEHLKTSWAAVGRDLGIPGGTAHRIATSDYEPKRADIRFHLGLPALIPAPACSKCGQLHVSRRCPNGQKPPTNWRDEEAGWQRLMAWFNDLAIESSLSVNIPRENVKIGE